MNLKPSIVDKIFLFDEQGTPTFINRESDSFLGVAITYNISDEDQIMNQADQQFGLSNTSPLRNRFIGSSRVNKIVDFLVGLNANIQITKIDLSNEEFQQTLTLYEQFSNILRNKYRGLRERSLSHILHSQSLDHCVFNAVQSCVEQDPSSITFNIFIDNWGIPVNDTEIYLEQRRRSFQEKINSIHEELNINIRVSFPSINLLVDDTIRKRFIGVLASVVSRSFLNHEHERFSDYPINTLINVAQNSFTDITDDVLHFIRLLMNEASKIPPYI